VVGAGLAGISAATTFQSARCELAVLEKTRRAGGVWRSFGNAFSRVNSTEPGYRLRLKHRHYMNTNHSHHHEILQDCLHAFEQFGLAASVFPGTEVVAIASCKGATSWWLGCAARTAMSCAWAILCTNRRLGAPRDLSVAGEASFAGQIRRGISNDALDVTWKAQRCLILGHGPFATENARTALEHGAADVTFGVRRHGCAAGLDPWPSGISRFSGLCRCLR